MTRDRNQQQADQNRQTGTPGQSWVMTIFFSHKTVPFRQTGTPGQSWVMTLLMFLPSILPSWPDRHSGTVLGYDSNLLTSELTFARQALRDSPGFQKPEARGQKRVGLLEWSESGQQKTTGGKEETFPGFLKSSTSAVRNSLLDIRYSLLRHPSVT